MILIANRGEIACRVIASARQLGIPTVAVYSEADAGARHVQMADHSLCLGGSAAADSYLNIDKVLAACRTSGATMVHPGYGFLSENAQFSRACRDAGIKFIGPSPESIEGLGNKSAGKALAMKLGVPCLPGYSGAEQDEASLQAQALKVGFPLMIKAAAGGGGRGMRRVDSADQLPAALRAAKLEALSGFGSDQLLIERLVEQARHIEIQIFGDQHGHVVHFGERDCSTQRRNQKILEEAPAPGLHPDVRAAMGEAAMRLARGVAYEGAGTIEFLFEDRGDGRGDFYFLEMNTRLQVEHPVTEAVTGLDLVALQIAIAQGQSLDSLPIAHQVKGHAIEARLCAEDAFAGFVPQPGPIAHWQFPQIAGLRIDHGLAAQAQIPRHYDSMIAKLIAWGPTREIARSRLIAGLSQTRILGLTTNRDYLIACLQAEPFSGPRLSTRWLDAHGSRFNRPQADARWQALAAGLLVHHQGLAHGPLAQWSSMGSITSPMRLGFGDAAQALRVSRAIDQPGRFLVQADSGEASPGSSHEVAIAPGQALDVVHHASIDGLATPVFARIDARAERLTLLLDALGIQDRVEDLSAAPPNRESTQGGGHVTARMHGAVRAIAVAPGQAVTHGERLMSLEAMKMEHSINAPCDGTVKALHVQEGQQVSPGRLMIEITPKDSA